MNLLLTIITPVFNGANLLKDTLESIDNQSYKNIEYIIVDGGSSDGTLELIQEYRHIVTRVISEKDNGMYEALSKGLQIAKGDVICYLNAGDKFYEKTAEVVVNIFSENDLLWLTGYRSVCNEDNIVTRIGLPFRYKSNLIERGVYGKWLPYIQQESTFWKKELNDSVDLDKLKSLKLAGDYYLWYCFSKDTSLEIIKTPLGIFKIHEGQLSENLTNYWSEIQSFVSKKNLFTVIQICFEAFFWLLDSGVREKLIKNVWHFDFKTHTWVCGKRKV
ncbi:glycosyltransferase family 2 protein [Candidatus Thioglobus sp.]|uniref:glycosyltransferase family 2 protein n=1 Tax=Candidatus Thioglobus sp. TaxID=2026721 RepID=UPI003D0BCEFB